MTPLGSCWRTELGLSRARWWLAVMFGAAQDFCSPIGYQDNTIVHAAGNYRFSDFLENRLADEPDCRARHKLRDSTCSYLA